jgi:hypothetical protein
MPALASSPESGSHPAHQVQSIAHQCHIMNCVSFQPGDCAAYGFLILDLPIQKAV